MGVRAGRVARGQDFGLVARRSHTHGKPTAPPSQAPRTALRFLAQQILDPHEKLFARVHLKLAIDGLRVGLHGIFRHVQFLSYGSNGAPARQKHQHLVLARAQTEPVACDIALRFDGIEQRLRLVNRDRIDGACGATAQRKSGARYSNEYFFSS